MQLILMILVTVAIMVLLSGIAVVLGSPKAEKTQAFQYLLSVLGASIWTLAFVALSALRPGSEDLAPITVFAIITGTTMCNVFLLSYLSWRYRGGRTLTFLAAIFGIAIVAILATNPSVFYSEIILNVEEASTVVVTKGWYYYTLIGYFFLTSLGIGAYIQKRIKTTPNKGMKTGLTIFYVGLTIASILSLIFNLVLMSSYPHLTWIGPMATSISVLSFFYSVVRYRTVFLSSRWVKLMSFAILIATGLVLYLLLFYILFTAIFHVAKPSPAVLLLNTIMMLIFIAALPAFNEFVAFMRSTLSTERVDMGYIINKIDRIDKRNFDQKEIARFLADNLHYSRVTLILDGKLYPSDNSRLAIADAEKILSTKPCENSIWILPDNLESPDLVKHHDISRVAILTDKKGKELGRLVFGKKLNRYELSRRDLLKYESVVNLLGSLIEDCK